MRLGSMEHAQYHPYDAALTDYLTVALPRRPPLVVSTSASCLRRERHPLGTAPNDTGKYLSPERQAVLRCQVAC